jgi:hypothetical protein
MKISYLFNQLIGKTRTYNDLTQSTFLEIQIVHQLIKTFPPFMKLKSSLQSFIKESTCASTVCLRIQSSGGIM